MIRNVKKLMRGMTETGSKSAQTNNPPTKPQTKLQSFDQNVETLRSVYSNCADVVFRSFLLGGNTRATIVYIEGLTDINGLEQYVLEPLMNHTADEMQSIDGMMERKLPLSKVQKLNLLADCIESISSGNPVLCMEGTSDAFSMGLAKWDKRSIEEPSAEGVVRGPREGFIESMEVNTSLLRRIIKSPALKIQTMKIGTYTNSTIAMAYIDGIADQTLIDEMTNRLKRIRIDGVLESGYIEEMIEDNPFSPFPQLLSTERPDVVCANLLEGRTALLIEGTPFALVAPVSFFTLLQSQEDYYQRYIFGTAIRWLRFLFLGISLLLPSLYVAILTFHQEAIPASLLLSIAASRESVPFPAIVEALLMEVTFEALREAGVRLPKQIGAAVSIVGALVIGQAAVQAGLVSAPMVIVVSITGIASFMMPRYITGIAIRLLRFPIILMAGTLGLLGIIMGVIAMVIHLCTLRSFGVPYLSPLAPIKFGELKDTLWRAPWWMMDTRPHLTGKTESYRESANMEPSPQKGGDPA